MNFYKDHLYKKLKPKSDGKIIAFLLFILKNYKIVLNKFVKYLVLENLLETTEQRLAKTNQVSLFNKHIFGKQALFKIKNIFWVDGFN